MSKLYVPSKVNGGAVRIVALLTVLISVVAAATASSWLAGLLALDFAIRGVATPRWSPLAALARLVQPRTPFRGTPIFFAPKRFAARIGLTLSAAGALLLAFGMPAVAGAVLGILAFFAFLEGAFNYCVGCKIYGILIRRGLIPRENCPDCV
jgi:hypothetical protein